ncbi:hypothetical protein [Streptomyces dysideae]|uniref:Uncharacterized protein n=1 Tax=Streptomyces dysideae TaxID=909626 RepID=A0A117RXS9_9ACTN|nr:hypothetical protein [Streptomyces dysideae]KUO15062.1 hypothetical protein AQJ91_43445 [Streptomyces dysideae]
MTSTPDPSVTRGPRAAEIRAASPRAPRSEPALEAAQRLQQALWRAALWMDNNSGLHRCS